MMLLNDSLLSMPELSAGYVTGGIGVSVGASFVDQSCLAAKCRHIVE